MSSFIKQLTRKVFARHSNPWSAWSRLLSAPLIFVPIWNRSWRQGTVLGVWLIVNPVLFPEPEDDGAWATRAMLGEEMWIAKRPLDRSMALNVGATVLGLGGVWGALRQRPLPTVVCAVGQVALLLAYWREMALYYERHRDQGFPPRAASGSMSSCSTVALRREGDEGGTGSRAPSFCGGNPRWRQVTR